MNTEAKTVQVSVDESIFKKFKNSFTSFECVIKEAMQNARRANATSVSFNTSGTYLKVIDNGEGFSSLQDFLSLSGSGWNEELIEREGAFGMGSFAMLYASSSITVASNGWSFEGNTDEILDGKAIEVKSCDVFKGAEITLGLFSPMETDRFNRLVEGLAKGFPIEVFVNGEKCMQPYRLDSGSYIKTSIGHCRMRGINLERGQHNFRNRKNFRLYYQGLPVSVPEKHSGDTNIIHLNEKAFSIRMPDREVLIDANDSIKAIISGLEDVWKEHLVSLKPLMDDYEFANGCYDDLHYWQCLHLLNDVPVLPKQSIFEVKYKPHCERAYIEEDCFGVGITMHRDDVSKILCIDSHVFEDSISSWSYAYYVGATCYIDKSLDSKHWICEHIIDPDEFSLMLSVDVANKTKSKTFRGDWVYAGAHFGEKVVMDGPLGSVEINNNAIFHEDAFYIPKGALSGEEILMACHFTEEDDNYNSTAYENESDMFAAFLMRHNGSTLEALESVLKNRFITALGIRSQKFELTFNEGEGIEVKDIT